jgi:hypothetical protein
MQVAFEPQWRSFKLAADVLSESGLLQNAIQYRSRKLSSPAEDARNCHREHKLRADVWHLCRRQRAACTSLESHIRSYVQVPSLPAPTVSLL